MTIRLRSLRMVNWRSIEDAEIELGEGTPALLYGENEAGKSNVLAAIETFCRLLSKALEQGYTEAGLKFPWYSAIPGQTDPEFGVKLHNPIRHGQDRSSLTGALVNEQGEPSSIRFEVGTDPFGAEGIRKFYGVEIAELEGSIPQRAPSVLRVGDSKSFHEEFLAPGAAVNDYAIDPDGTNVKAALFRCANHSRTDYRARFYDEFRALVRASPFGLPDPIVAYGDQKDIQLLFDERPVEERGRLQAVGAHCRNGRCSCAGHRAH